VCAVEISAYLLLLLVVVVVVVDVKTVTTCFGIHLTVNLIGLDLLPVYAADAAADDDIKRCRSYLERGW